MSNKYIDVICSENYGAVDSARDKQIKSAGLGLLIGSVALIAVPAILMSSGSMKKHGSSALGGIYSMKDLARKFKREKKINEMTDQEKKSLGV